MHAGSHAAHGLRASSHPGRGRRNLIEAMDGEEPPASTRDLDVPECRRLVPPCPALFAGCVQAARQSGFLLSTHHVRPLLPPYRAYSRSEWRDCRNSRPPTTFHVFSVAPPSSERLVDLAGNGARVPRKDELCSLMSDVFCLWLGWALSFIIILFGSHSITGHDERELRKVAQSVNLDVSGLCWRLC